MAFPPRVVRARGVPKSEQIRLLLGEEAWNGAVHGGDLAKIGQYLRLVYTGMQELQVDQGLLRAHALWQGLERPANDHPQALDYYAYILKPSVTFTFNPKINDVDESPAPKQAVFMVTVYMPPPGDGRLASWSRSAGVDVFGEIQDWEWFTADEFQTDQPKRPGSRFRERHW